MPVDSQYYPAEQADGSPQPEAQNCAGEVPKDSSRELSSEAPREAPREADGRWQKGASGNPAGRPKGARNEATRMAERLLDFYAAKLTAEAIHQALKGDSVALRFRLDPMAGLGPATHVFPLLKQRRGPAGHARGRRE